MKKCVHVHVWMCSSGTQKHTYHVLNKAVITVKSIYMYVCSLKGCVKFMRIRF